MPEPRDWRKELKAVRKLLGTDVLQGIPALLIRMENHMASARDQLDALSAKVDDIAADVRVIQAKAGQLDDEGQAALDRLTDKLSAFDTEVGDADGSDAPASEQPAEQQSEGGEFR